MNVREIAVASNAAMIGSGLTGGAGWSHPYLAGFTTLAVGIVAGILYFQRRSSTQEGS